MIEVVIIGQNEYASMEKMLASLSPYGFKRIWVLDRCTDESESFLMEHNEFYVKTPADLVGLRTPIKQRYIQYKFNIKCVYDSIN